MKLSKVIAACLTSVMLLMPLTSCGSSAQKKFVVGFDSEFPPMGFVEKDGSYAGFDLDLAKEVAKRLDMEFVAQPIAWDSKDQELKSGNISCIWNGFTITEERKDAYEWSDPYMKNQQVVVVKNDSSVKSLADLAGLKVCVQKDSSGLAALEGKPELTATFSELVQVDSYLNALMELESGSVDAIVMDEIVARYEIQTSGKPFVVLTESIASEEYGVGFRKGSDLVAELNAFMKSSYADGSMQKIAETYGVQAALIEQ